jgi:hypothetical protein
LPVEPVQAPDGPLIDGTGRGLIVTLYWAVVAVHVVAVIVSVTCTQPDPLAPHVTVIELLVVEPMIVPPEIAHE